MSFSNHVATYPPTSTSTSTRFAGSRPNIPIRFGLFLFGVGVLVGRMSHSVNMTQTTLRDIQGTVLSSSSSSTKTTTTTTTNFTTASTVSLSARNHSEMVKICQTFLMKQTYNNNNAETTTTMDQKRANYSLPVLPSTFTTTNYNANKKDLDNLSTTTSASSSNATTSFSYAAKKKNDSMMFPSHPLCNLLAATTSSSSSSLIVPSATSLWMQHLDKILNASQLPKDYKFVERRITIQLLDMISKRLPLSVKSVVRDWTSVDAIMNKAYQRYKYLTEQSPSQSSQSPPPPPPIRILVMGGSVTVGTNCRMPRGIPITQEQCSWRRRLPLFLNTLLGPVELVPNNKNATSIPSHKNQYPSSLVEVTTIAYGGANSDFGARILEYDIIPPRGQNPDIIINAYSTNDMHLHTVEQAKMEHIPLEELILNQVQDWVRTALLTPITNQNKCNNDNNDTIVETSITTTTTTTTTTTATATSQSQPPPRRQRRRRRRTQPLIIHWNDYLGNDQHDIYGTMALTRAISVLSGYYGFAAASSADAVRDVVYGDTQEGWFSPSGWYSQGIYGREIHPGSQAHRTMMWIMAYNLLNLVTTRCNMVEYGVGEGSQTVADLARKEVELTASDKFDGNAKPRLAPHYSLPPPLTKDLMLQNVTELWRNAEDKAIEFFFQSDDENDNVDETLTGNNNNMACYKNRCPISWVEGTQDYLNMNRWVEKYFEAVTKEQTNWGFKGRGKRGFVPNTVGNNRLTWDFEPFQQPISSITLFNLKSYGEKWADSTIVMHVWKNPPTYIPLSNSTPMGAATATGAQEEEEPMISQTFVGYHGKNTSETYVNTVILPSPLSVGDTLRLQFTLVRGTTFLIQGIIVCSS